MMAGRDLSAELYGTPAPRKGGRDLSTELYGAATEPSRFSDEAMKERLVEAAAPLEVAASLASGLYGATTGGIRGLASLVSGEGADIASEHVKRRMEENTWQPRGQGAKAILQGVAYPFEKAREGLSAAGNVVGRSLSSEPPDSEKSQRYGDIGASVAEPLLDIGMAAQGGVAGLRAAKGVTIPNPFTDMSGKLQRGAQNLMFSALKPTAKQYASGSADVAVQELLKRNLSPNLEGVTAINNRISELQAAIANAIKDSPATISKQAVLDQLVSVRDRFMKTVNPEADLAAIQSVGAEFERHPLIQGKTLPIQLAQDIKKGTYTELRNKYGELGTAQTEAQKALARGLKEEVAAQAPKVAPLNAEESALFKTLDVVERRQFLEMNKDPVPMTGIWRNPALFAAYTADKSAAFKALLARLMYRAGGSMKPAPQKISSLAVEHGFVPGEAPPLAISSGLATPQIQIGGVPSRKTGLELVPKEGEMPSRSLLFPDEAPVPEAYNTLNPFTQPNQGVNPLLRSKGRGLLSAEELPPILPVPEPALNTPLPKIERAFKGKDEFVLPNETGPMLPPTDLSIQKQLGRKDIFTPVEPRSRSAQSLLDTPSEGGMAHVERGLLSMADDPATVTVTGQKSKNLAPIDYLPTDAKVKSFKSEVARIRKAKSLSEEAKVKIDGLLDKLGGINESQRVAAMKEIRKIIESSKE